MDVVVTTSDPEVVSAKDVAVALLTMGEDVFYVRSVTVIDRATGLVADRWGQV